MMFIENRILLIISAIVILLLAIGFYVFKPFDREAGAVQVNKLVSNPQTSIMVDNLGVNDPGYGPGSIVSFQLWVINTSDSRIPKVTIKDIFPQYVDFDKGEGSFDSGTRTLTLNIEDMKPREEKVINFSGKVSEDLPLSPNILCVENQVNATVQGGAGAQDTSRFCIDKKIAIEDADLALSSSPATGPEALALFLLVPTGIIGWSLRKYSHP